MDRLSAMILIQSIPIQAPEFIQPASRPLVWEAVFQMCRQKKITVFRAGMADFTSSPDLGAELPLPNVEIQFTNQSTDAVSFLWDFGDGTFSTEENPLHVYNEAGEYTVTLTITDAGGCTDVIQYGPYKIFIPGLLIPNVFSPNGDGIK